jgi:hypothetical protein
MAYLIRLLDGGRQSAEDGGVEDGKSFARRSSESATGN